MKTASKIVGSALTPLSAIYWSKKELAILYQTKLAPLIVYSNYYRQANVLQVLVRKQIALETVFTTVP